MAEAAPDHRRAYARSYLSSTTPTGERARLGQTQSSPAAAAPASFAQSFPVAISVATHDPTTRLRT